MKAKDEMKTVVSSLVGLFLLQRILEFLLCDEVATAVRFYRQFVSSPVYARIVQGVRSL